MPARAERVGTPLSEGRRRCRRAPGGGVGGGSRQRARALPRPARQAECLHGRGISHWRSSTRPPTRRWRWACSPGGAGPSRRAWISTRGPGGAPSSVSTSTLVATLARFPKPLVAAVNGLAVGSERRCSCTAISWSSTRRRRSACRSCLGTAPSGKQLAPPRRSAPTGGVDDALGLRWRRRRGRHRLRPSHTPPPPPPRYCGLAGGTVSRRLGPWTSTTSPTTSTGWRPSGSRRAGTPAPARPGLRVTAPWPSGSRSSVGRRSPPGWETDWPATGRTTSRTSSVWAPNSGRPRRGSRATSCADFHAAGATWWRDSSPRRRASPPRRAGPSPMRSSTR